MPGEISGILLVAAFAAIAGFAVLLAVRLLAASSPRDGR